MIFRGFDDANNNLTLIRHSNDIINAFFSNSSVIVISVCLVRAGHRDNRRSYSVVNPPLTNINQRASIY